jgi:hypothetical protein
MKIRTSSATPSMCSPLSCHDAPEPGKGRRPRSHRHPAAPGAGIGYIPLLAEHETHYSRRQAVATIRTVATLSAAEGKSYRVPVADSSPHRMLFSS